MRFFAGVLVGLMCFIGGAYYGLSRAPKFPMECNNNAIALRSEHGVLILCNSQPFANDEKQIQELKK